MLCRKKVIAAIVFIPTLTYFHKPKEAGLVNRGVTTLLCYCEIKWFWSN